MAPSQYTRIVLNERPAPGTPIVSNTFRKEVVPFDLKPGKGEVLVRMLYISLDPAMRSWLNEARGYMEPVKIGETMKAGAIAEVVDVGEGAAFAPGDLVNGQFGWAEYMVHNGAGLKKVVVPEGAQLLDFLGLLGMNGMTAYFGLFDVGKIKPGETLVVSGAAGATGSIVCQLGKLVGAKVIAIAGTPDKCEWLEKELGVDKALNYKSPTFRQDFRKSVGFLDVYFDNVGGEILDLALTRLNKFARIAFCGAISDYNQRPKGITNYMNLISQSAKLDGFLVFDYVKQFPQALQEMGKWLGEGKLKYKFHIVTGLEKAPEALPMLFEGRNQGKL
ncbi:alcohol dehydrogenase [Panus rudis PR-1116 ss-1]|nr:alcohol dehydrogenase [Panus rudis PR-1116 ss-1]